MDLSIIIPLFNEDESLPELAAWIERVVNSNGYSYEIIMIDDGSTDNSWAVIENFEAPMQISKALNFSEIMARAQRSMKASKPHRATLSSQWTLICRTAPTRFLNSEK